MKRTLGNLLWVGVFLLTVAFVMPASGQTDDALIKQVLTRLNSSETVRGTEDTKSYKILFDAYLQLTKPPFEVGPEFNLNTIHPKMPNWSEVSGWAESNAKMAEAIIKCKDKIVFGLPYGLEKIDQSYQSANLVADIGSNGSLRNVRFPYLHAIDTIAAFTAAETYRLMELGQTQPAFNLAMANCFVLRQCCDRDFLAEKLHSIELLSSSLSNLRDIFYHYLEIIPAEQYTQLSWWELPYLRPDRGRLFMPEADRIVAEALINEVFSSKTGEADPDKFTDTFAEIQSKNAPLTRFGAAKRWRMIAEIHGSLDASQERLKLIYDDWWRRWRIDAYDDILAVQTQFDRTNPIRYAAVIYSVEDVAILFQIRNRLVAEVSGTAMAAGLCAYHKTYGVYPDQTINLYGQSARKRSDSDPYDKQLGPFQYRVVRQRQSIDTPEGRLWVEPDGAIMWSQGQDHEDQRAAQHTDDGVAGDLVLWPPIKAMQRAQGLIQ